jgi:CO/xanthine dehydrogenase Mo-binding subunit
MSLQSFRRSRDAEATLSRDGAVVRIGAAECGQGVATVLAQIAAETLELPANRVRLEWQDTESAPEAGSSSASRQTLVSGNAVRGACERARRAVAKKGGVAVLPAAGITRRTRTTPAHWPDRRAACDRMPAYGWACVADVRRHRQSGTRLRISARSTPVVKSALFGWVVEGGVMGQGYALQERCILRDGMPILALTVVQPTAPTPRPQSRPSLSSRRAAGPVRRR